MTNEANIVNKTRPLFTLSLEMTRLVNEIRLLLVPCVNSDIYGTLLCISPVAYHILSNMSITAVIQDILY